MGTIFAPLPPPCPLPPCPPSHLLATHPRVSYSPLPYTMMYPIPRPHANRYLTRASVILFTAMFLGSISSVLAMQRRDVSTAAQFKTYYFRSLALVTVEHFFKKRSDIILPKFHFKMKAFIREKLDSFHKIKSLSSAEIE